MENFPSLKKPSHLISTFFGVGLLPFAPGTWGSLVALLLFYLLIFFQLSFSVFTLILLLFSLISIITCEIATKNLTNRDQKSIVVDEISGLWTSFLFIPLLGLYDFSNSEWQEGTFLATFILFLSFRFFDILKPHPISFVDRNFKTGFGIVLDDLVAGVFAGLSLLGGNFFINIF